MNQRFLDQTYYEILEIPHESAEHEIHKAYLRAKETYSPDSPALYTMFSPEEAAELSRLIEEAYTVLSNHSARKEYDSRLIGQQPTSTATAHAQAQATFVAKSPVTAAAMNRPSQKIISHNEPLPEGFAKTKFGNFKIDNNFEALLNSTHDYNGKFLSEVRVYKQIPIEALGQEIRVSKSYMRAIENDDYEALPADVFVRGFVLQYAKALDLDDKKVASSFMKILRNARS